MTVQIVPRYEIICDVQEYCADLAEQEVTDGESRWTVENGAYVARLLNQDSDPWGLFRYIDEKTGASDVGYRSQRTKREWHYILRQMRNTVGSGLFENMTPRYS